MGINPCCCISASRGAMAIAGLQIMGGARGLVSNAKSYFQQVDFESELEKEPSLKDVGFEEMSKEYPGHDDLDHIFSTIRILLVYGLVINTLDVICGSLLLYAAKHERPPLLKMYLIVYGILLVPSVSITLIFTPPPFKYIVLFCYIFYVYFLLVVYAAYLEFRNKPIQNLNPAVAYAKA